MCREARSEDKLMVIWEYLVPNTGGATARRWGTPVDVFVPGMGYVQLVYQFPCARWPACVVHHASGRVIAKLDGREGPIQEQARAGAADMFLSVLRKHGTAAEWHASIRSSFSSAPTLNTTVKVVS